MKKKGLFVLMLALFLSISTASIIYANNEKQPNISANELKDKMDIDIAEVNDTAKSVKITKDQAIDIAKEFFPENAESKNIKAQLNAMTNKGFKMFSPTALEKNPTLKEKGYLDNAPVWIVSCKGLTIHRSGGTMLDSEQKKANPHTEENVVIDAITGEPLYTFSFR